MSEKKTKLIDMGERGFYNPKNKLNDLTGKEWLYFTNSVWITGYSPTAIANVGLKFRKIHPSPKPPGLIKDIIQFFTKANSLVLDPFVGVGGTLLGAALAGNGRKAVGIDLEERYRNAYFEVCKSEKLEKMQFVIGDAEHVLRKHKTVNANMYDLIIADPPYSNMMSLARTKSTRKQISSPYTDTPCDLGNMDEIAFYNKLQSIISKAVTLLKKDKYLVVFCKDFQPKGKNANLLHCQVIQRINEIEELEYKGMRIWHDQAMSLYPFGYPFSFVMNQIHQYVLIFRKTKE